MSRSTGAREGSQTVLGECGYCGDTIVAKKHKFLPLECANCKGVYHVACLKGSKPQTLLGDQLFKFSCAYCNPLSQEICSRPYLHWVHITHLVLYNLMIGRKGPRGKMGSDMREYFRWNEDICGFMRTHWTKLMPERKRTQSWRSTVAGTLSVNCPTVFTSGQSMFGESGWWTLTSVVPPDPRQAITSSPPSLGKRSTSLTVSPSTPLSPRLKTFSHLYSLPQPPPAKRPKAHPIKALDLSHMTERQEAVLLTAIEGQEGAVASNPRAARLLRKLKVRKIQRRYGQANFNLDTSLSALYADTVKYVIDTSKSYYEQVVPYKKASSKPTVTPPTGDQVTSGEAVLKRITVLGHALPHAHTTLRHTLVGGAFSLGTIVSPYTARVLKPYIFRTPDLCPLRVKLNQEICRGGYEVKSFDFVYLRDHLLSGVNSFLSSSFWPVDVSEYLQYPDFTCVVLYGHMIVGCAFMTPDIKVNEAYISFLLVHTEFQGTGIGKLMLYHLVQTCMGKDVTLHVSVDNPAMLLYNKFGFKAEKYCLDFYEHYYPGSHYLSKHAYFMRLKR